MNVRNVATKVAGNLDGNAAFDPSIIFLIMEIITELIATLQDNCDQDPEDVPAIAARPRRIQKWVLKRTVRRTLGRRAYRRHGSKVVSNLLKTGRKLTTSQVQDLFDEVD